jgi:hypothetical protein
MRATTKQIIVRWWMNKNIVYIIDQYLVIKTE